MTDAFIPPALPHNDTAPIHKTRIVREKTLRTAICAVKVLDDADVVMVLATMLEGRSRVQMDRMLSEAERLLRKATRPVVKL